MTQMSTLHTITKRLALIAAATFLLVVFAGPVLAQAAPKPAEAPVVRKKTLMDHFHEGGWVMYPILLCSIGTAYLVWEGFNRTSIKKMAPPVHEEQVKSMFRAGDYIGAYDYCKNNPVTADQHAAGRPEHAGRRQSPDRGGHVPAARPRSSR